MSSRPREPEVIDVGPRKRRRLKIWIIVAAALLLLNVAFNEPTIAVDTHIFRVGNRTGLAPGKTPLEVERKLEAAIPAKWKMGAHHWLILHGRYVCKARKPLCGACVVRERCAYKAKTELALDTARAATA